VETLRLQTLSVLFFIEIGTRRIHLAGSTMHPPAALVAQQACQLVWKLQDPGRVMCFVLYDRDAKFPTSFDGVFASEGNAVILTRLARAECQCLCGALDPQRARKVLGSSAHPGMNVTWNTSCMNTACMITVPVLIKV
jgi:hypothetical protein